MKRLIALTQNSNCRDCKVCCRFEEASPNLKPSGLRLVKCGETYICELFDPLSGKCCGYGRRPFDCEVYPFAVALSQNGEDILLVIDSLCPNTEGILDKLEPSILEKLDFDADSAIKWEDSFIPLKILKSTGIINSELNLLKRDSRFFFNHFKTNPPPLSAYGFAYHFIWDDITTHYWKTIDGIFYVFSKTGKEIIIPLAPAEYKETSLLKCFELLESLNSNKEIARIENAGENFALAAKKTGFKVSVKDSEYLYETKVLAELKGDNYKSMRWLCNTFEQHKNIEWRAFETSDLEDSAQLLNLWYNKKITETTADNDLFLLRHALKANRNALSMHRELGLTGMTVRLGSKLVAYTLGAPLSNDTFCVYFEITDPETKGASQYIFREFCRMLKGYKFINTMGDEGIVLLKISKELYKPAGKPVNYTITAV